MGGEGGDSGVGGSEPMPNPGLELEAPVRLRMRTGSSVAVPFEIERTGSFEGGVLVSMEGLPRGLLSDSATLTGASFSGGLTLIAAGDALTGGPFSVRIKATSLDGELEKKIDIDLVVAGAAGSLDRDFGNNGLIRLDANAFAGMHVNADGGTIVAYTIGNRSGTGSTIARFDASGRIDPSFAPPLDGKFGVYSGFAVGGDQIALAVGNYGGDTAKDGLVVLDQEGRPAEEFGTNGFVNFPFAEFLQRRVDGSLYVATVQDTITVLDETGETDPAYSFYGDDCLEFVADGANDRLIIGCSSETEVTFARVLEDGSLDESFASSGGPTVPLNSIHEWVRSVVTAPGGAFLVTVHGEAPRLLKFNEDGSPDLSFGAQGQLAMSSAHETLSVFALGSGFLVFSRETIDSAGVVQLLDWNGEVVTSFGQNGGIDLVSLSAPLEYSPHYGSPRIHAEDDARGRVVIAIQNSEFTSVLLRVWL